MKQKHIKKGLCLLFAGTMSVMLAGCGFNNNNSSTSTSVIPSVSASISQSISTSTDISVKPHEHSYSSAYSFDDEGHWREATCEHKEEHANYAVHTFSEWQADELQKTESRKCTICSYAQVRELTIVEPEQPEEPPMSEVESKTPLKISDVKLGVGGYEWGASVDTLLVKLDIPKGELLIDRLSVQMFSVKIDESDYPVKKLFFANEIGEELTEDQSFGGYLGIQIDVKAYQLDPFIYSENGSKWSKESLHVSLYLKDGYFLAVKTSNTEIVNYKLQNFDEHVEPSNRVMPDLKDVKSDSYTDRPYVSDAGRTATLTYAWWEPKKLKEDGGKNPLIIWLHGGGEGGTDPTVTFYGSDLTNLIHDDMQAYFKRTTNGENIQGAYVLSLQTPTFWLDDGSGSITKDGDSIYIDMVMMTLQHYLDVVNQDIDLNRIYIGGCSNGGYLTMALMLRYGSFFAAAFPVCEAYYNGWISDEQIAMLAGYNIWFTHSKNDTMVEHEKFTSATYIRLKQAGAKNIYYSFFETVTGIDDPTADRSGGEGGNYMGHSAWIYLLSDRCTGMQPSTVNELSDLVPSNALGGGAGTAVFDGKQVTLWSWLAAQVKIGSVK